MNDVIQRHFEHRKLIPTHVNNLAYLRSLTFYTHSNKKYIEKISTI